MARTTDLVLRALGTRGYLKLPDSFLSRFDGSVRRLPSPRASLDPGANGKVRLIYEWDANDLASTETQK